MAADADLTAFKFSACVDWIELRVRTLPDADGRATRGDVLRGRLKKFGVSYVKAVDRGAGGAATHFLVRVQAPETVRDVLAVVDRLAAHRELAAAPTIAAIEIAFDARPKTADRAALDAMTLRLMRGILPPTRELRTPQQWAGFALGLESALSAHHRPLDPSRTLYIGTPKVADAGRAGYAHGRLTTSYEAEKGASARADHERAFDHAQWRVYRKETDEQFTSDGERRDTDALQPGEHRARAEVTLTGQMLRILKLETLDDLATFDFSTIATKKLLRFVRVSGHPFFADASRQGLIVNALGIDKRTPAHIVAAFWHRDERGRENDLGQFLVADTDLNRRLKEQLARLSRRFRAIG
ncbi:hypothetical protein [Burkholderia guangdongensis]|uniref:hypothetical protein n=1 Tax=Burkholderia guangdongensis TaxID=1792500 RepID=UPI0015CA07B6|nr:hypothetical protein [Burkholderia guangdongensis]